MINIIKRHIAQAEAERQFHRARGPKLGNFEAMMAAHKIGWLNAILRECEAEEKAATVLPKPPRTFGK